MKKLIIYFLLLSLPAVMHAQYTVGTAGGDFATLQQAFDYINGGSISGDIILRLVDNTIETLPAVLLSSGGGINYTSVLIFPAVSGLSISGDFDGSLIDLNGADHVTFDGRVNQSGASDLTITNLNTGNSASTIRLIESANTNTIQYCKIKGSGMGVPGGIIFLSTATTGPGNSLNIFDNNNITSEGIKRPVNAIYSLGSAGFENSGNTLSNNNVFNVLNKGNASNGVLLDANNTGWTISGNSFYETSSFVPAASVAYNAIQINNSGINYNITGNFIGGQSALCGGSAWTKTSAFNNIFNAIDLTAGTGTASSIQNNTIRNFAWSNSSNASWTGIQINSGDANIGTLTGNTIGAPTGTGSILVTGGATNTNIYGINVSSGGTVVCMNNNIGSVTCANSNSAFSTGFYGINKTAAGSTTISNNNIGSPSTPNSISATSLSSGNVQSVFGIYSNGSGTITISNNIISNLSNEGTFVSAAGGQIVGISTKNGANTISGNSVNNLSSANPNSGTGDLASVIGISQTSSVSGQSVSGNNLYNLSNTYSGGNIVRIIGLNYSGGTGGTNLIDKNFINSLAQASTNTSSTILGIRINSGAATYTNNIISVGSEILKNHAIYGIYENGAVGNNNNLYFNTIFIGGNPTSGSGDSYALYSNASTNTRDFRNNIFVNARSNSGATGNHYAAYFNYIVNTNLTLDYNDYYAPGNGGILGFYSGNKTVLPIVTGQDVSSLAIDPVFANAGGTSASDYNPSISTLVAITGTGILTDYNGATRSITPTMGAFEVGACTNPTSGGTIAAAQGGCSPFDPAAFTSSLLPSGYIGPSLEYKWQQSVTSSSSGFSDIPGSNSSTYDPGLLTQTTWYKRVARVTCKSDWIGAAESNVVTVTVNALPVANPISGGDAVCMGDALTLVSNATGTPVLTYTWTSSNTGVATINNSGVLTTLSVGSTNITYKVTDGSSTACSATSPDHAITVNSLPVANPITGGNTVCLGSTLLLTPNATGTPVLNYTWSSSNTFVATVDNSGVVTPVDLGSTTIRYIVTDGSPTSCSAISATHSVTVNPLPVAGAITGGSEVCMGGTLSLTSNATGTPTLTYVWNSSNTSAATVNNSGIVTPVGPGSADITYTVTDGSASSCSATSPIHAVMVNALPIAGAITGGNAVCIGATLTLTANATGTPTLTYTWSSSNTSVATVDNSGVVTPVGPGTTNITYTVTDGSATACSSTSPVNTVTVGSVPIAGPITGGTSLCMGGTLSLNSNATGTPVLSYTWNSSDVTVATVNNSGLVTPVSPGSTNISYIVTEGSSASCSATSPLYSVTVNGLPTAGAITGSNTVAMGNSLSLTPNATGIPVLSYSWASSDPSIATINDSGVLTPVAPGLTDITYTVTDGSASPCSKISPVFPVTVIVGTADQTITFGPFPAVSYGASDFSPGASASSGLVVSYTSDNLNVATIINGKVHITGSGSSVITASQGGDGNYNPAPPASQTLTVNKAILTFTADNQTRSYLSQNPALTWSVSGYVYSETQSVLDNLPAIQTTADQNSQVGTYPITISGGGDNNYNFVFVAGTLSVGQISQIINFTDWPAKLLLKDTYTLIATSTSGIPVQFESKDAQIAEVDGDQITGVSRGNVQIRAFNPGDRNYYAGEAFVTIEVYSTHKDIMHLFTPNNDGINDYWELPDLVTWGKCNVKVYNRWGKMVYSNPDYNNLWDGTSDGSPLPEGPYYFIIKTENAGTINGTVNIVR
jgi:gliding motility-associated-like protein